MIRLRLARAGAVAGVVFATACGGDAFAPLPSAFTSVATGLIHSCGMVDGGGLYCWGNNEFGQLGDGSRSAREAPVPVLGSIAFAGFSPGGGHTCALTAQGRVYCWGFNRSGQLGDGTFIDRTEPAVTDATRSYLMLSAGGSYTCGIAADSAAYCWGWNQFSQLGEGGAIDRLTPTAVSGGLKFTSISAGSFHTCGVTDAGTGYCWGSNAFGQLGIGTLDSIASVPTRVSGSLTFADIQVGFDHSCGRALDGRAYCWGRNQWGQAGVSDTLSGNPAVPTVVEGGLRFASLELGANFSCAVEDQTGAAYCWGYNGWGELGAEVSAECLDPNGRPVQCAMAPHAVSGDIVFGMVSAATHHACGLSTARVAYCWGQNEDGQLGNGQRGSNLYSIQPVRVSGQP